MGPLRDSEFLSAIKHRSAIPGGTCDFDLPDYSYWLNRPAELRAAEFDSLARADPAAVRQHRGIAVADPSERQAQIGSRRRRHLPIAIRPRESVPAGARHHAGGSGSVSRNQRQSASLHHPLLEMARRDQPPRARRSGCAVSVDLLRLIRGRRWRRSSSVQPAGARCEWSPESVYRPFCSDRCRLIDLGAWFGEQHRIPDESPDRRRRYAAGFVRGTLEPCSRSSGTIAGGRVRSVFINPPWTGTFSNTGRTWKLPATAASSCLCAARASIFCGCEQAHSVAGVEISAVAVESFCLEHGIAARRAFFGDFDVYEADKLQLYRGDFFELSPELLGPVARSFDRAALIAWPPELRAAYVDQIYGPDPSGHADSVDHRGVPAGANGGTALFRGGRCGRALVCATHAIQFLSRQDVLAIEPRLRARGIAQLHEVCYRLTRKLKAPSS